MNTPQHECGFFISKKVSPTMKKETLEKELNLLLKDQKETIMSLLDLPKDKVHTGYFYDRDSNEYKGIIEIQAPCSAHILRDLNINNLIWGAIDDAPFSVFAFSNY